MTQNCPFRSPTEPVAVPVLTIQTGNPLSGWNGSRYLVRRSGYSGGKADTPTTLSRLRTLSQT